MAEGTYNLTSLGPPQEEEPLQQIHEVEDLDSIEVHEVLDEDGSITEMQTSDPAAVERVDSEILCHEMKKMRS